MPGDETSATRRQTMLNDLHGSSVNEAYRPSLIRSDLEPKAAMAGADALVAPSMLDMPGWVVPPEFAEHRGVRLMIPLSSSSFLISEAAGAIQTRKCLRAAHSLQSSRKRGAPWSTALHELILEASDLLPFDFLRTGDRLGRAVLKIQCEDGSVGTGFLIAPGILLTNHHVLPSPRAATSAFALANFETHPAGDAFGRPAVAPLDPASLFVSNAELDFTFCGVQGLDFLGSIPIDRNSHNIYLLEYVNIIQHPGGRPKEVALQDNRVVKADNVVIHYACDTEPGSSGSPVFNNRWQLVALHHASVLTDNPEGRFTIDTAAGARYLNEGIRVSAIATWLETTEANTTQLREQAARLRSSFTGLDPQMGFFGALGRQARGKTAGEVVANSYLADIDDLDIAFWSLGRLGHRFGEHLADVARAIAELRLDIWCLTHAHPASVRALCEHLDTNYQLNYEHVVSSPDTQPCAAVVYRRSNSFTVERAAWKPGELVGVSQEPLRVSVRTTTHCGQAVELLLAIVSDELPPERSEAGTESARLLLEAIAHEIIRSAARADWIVLGDAQVLSVLGGLQSLVKTGRRLTSGATGGDGAFALLAGPDSHIEQVFASPNLAPTPDHPERLLVTHDRVLPLSISSLTHPHPFAFRLAFTHGECASEPPETQPVMPIAIVAPAPGIIRTQPVPVSAVMDAQFEQRLHDMLLPMIAKIVAELNAQNSATDSGA